MTFEQRANLRATVMADERGDPDYRRRTIRGLNQVDEAYLQLDELALRELDEN